MCVYAFRFKIKHYMEEGGPLGTVLGVLWGFRFLVCISKIPVLRNDVRPGKPHTVSTEIDVLLKGGGILNTRDAHGYP